jgi:hypothetical protein
MLVVWGEAGMGKEPSDGRLRKAPDGPLARAGWSLCQSDQILRQSLNHFRYWLRRYFDQSGSPPENRRNFNQRLDGLIGEVNALADFGADLAGELRRTRSLLEALLDLHQPGSLYDQLDAQGRYENTLQALTALLQAESLRQPVIVHLEDADWLDEESRDFVSRLVRMLSTDDGRRCPIAVIATARPAFGWDAGTGESGQHHSGMTCLLRRCDCGALVGRLATWLLRCWRRAADLSSF